MHFALISALSKNTSKQKFCVAHNVDPYITTWENPVPMLQVFGEIYRDGCMVPHNKPIKARTVGDGIRSVGQAHA
jgi:hypothetical protein